MKFAFLSLTVLLLVVASVHGQSRKPRTLDELPVAYTGSDRQQILVEGAKSEGKVVWYTSLSGVYRELVDAFKRKYPDIAVDVYRGGSNDLTPRIINEAQAGRPVADALESTPGLLMALRDRGLLKSYVSPELAKFPDEAKGKADGARVFWVTDREAYMGFGYNTRLITPNEVPKKLSRSFRGPNSRAKSPSPPKVPPAASSARCSNTKARNSSSACARKKCAYSKRPALVFSISSLPARWAAVQWCFKIKSRSRRNMARRWIGCR